MNNISSSVSLPNSHATNNSFSRSSAGNQGQAPDSLQGASSSLANSQTTAEKLLSQPSSLASVTQYTVRSGDSLGAIASRHGVSVEALAAHNGIANPNRIFVGDSLSIPQTGSSTNNSTQSYQIKPGDTLNAIADSYGVSVGSITSANNISNPNRIYPGDTITIPQVGSAPSSQQTYEIKPGDTLNDIANTYGVSVESITSANNIANPNRIYPGDVITIIGGSAPSPTVTDNTPSSPTTSPVSDSNSPFNIQAVIDAVPASVRRANPDIATHVNNILEMSAKHGLSADQTAYVLGTATHESALGAYMQEFASGRAYEGRADLGNTETGDGVRFKGRGYVQVTGRANYQDWSNRLGVDLMSNPSLAEQPHIAAEILVVGMKEGSFTGRNLDRYINDGGTDFVNARRIVNGTDRASLIAGYANTFQAALATPITSR